MQVAEPITADQYLAMDLEDQRTQLIDGAIVMSEPTLHHQVLHGRLFAALHAWVLDGGDRGLVVSPLDVQLDDRNVYAPDLLWYGAERTPPIRAPRPYPIPDLAIEIRSPSTWRDDIGAKKRTYEHEGLPELWLVDGEAGVLLVFRRSAPSATTFDVALELDGSATLASPLLAGFTLDVGELFDVA
ncbi:MAG: Uma2 family endonuclease [Solirubrobacteraceae bacterium]